MACSHVKDMYPDYVDLDDEGAPGSHKKIDLCMKCGKPMDETVERHSFKKDLQWHCFCGAADPTKYRG